MPQGEPRPIPTEVTPAIASSLDLLAKQQPFRLTAGRSFERAVLQPDLGYQALGETSGVAATPLRQISRLAGLVVPQLLFSAGSC